MSTLILFVGVGKITTAIKNQVIRVNMDIAALVVGFLTFLFALWIYLFHDKKIKEQEKRLNEIALEKAKKERIKSLQANISVKWANGKFVFTNEGEADATDVSATLEGYSFDKPFSCQIMHPGDVFYRSLMHGNPPEHTFVKCKWTDKSGPRFKSTEVDLSFFN